MPLELVLELCLPRKEDQSIAFITEKLNEENEILNLRQGMLSHYEGFRALSALPNRRRLHFRL